MGGTTMLSKALHDEIYARVHHLGMDDWLKLRHGDREAIAAFAEKNGFTAMEVGQYFAEEAGEGWRKKPPYPAQKMPAVPDDNRVYMWPGDPSFYFDLTI
jgi:hypothetical protein